MLHVAPNHDAPRSSGKRIPRKIDKVISEATRIMSGGFEPATSDTTIPSFISTVMPLLNKLGVDLLYNKMLSWRDSSFCSCRDMWRGNPAFITLGGKGSNNEVCSALLHELGHAILTHNHNHPRSIIDREVEAWEVAQQLAAAYRLPLVAKIKRETLYGYRTTLASLTTTCGSKNNTKTKHVTKIEKLKTSRRSVGVKLVKDRTFEFALGRKGSRIRKREMKKWTHKAERRFRLEDEVDVGEE